MLKALAMDQDNTILLSRSRQFEEMIKHIHVYLTLDLLAANRKYGFYSVN